MNRSGYQLKLNLFLSTGWGPLQIYAMQEEIALAEKAKEFIQKIE